MIEYQHSRREGRDFITLIRDGDLLEPITDTHPNYDRIVQGAYEGDESVFDLIDIGGTIADKFREVTERVSVANGRVYFDHDEIPNSILKAQILRSIDGRIDSLAPCVNFLERVQNNPEPHSREMLFDWLNAHDFTISLDGYIVGYKGVRSSGDSYVSINSGTAIVDGVTHTGNIPNAIGTTISMPRSKVEHNPSNGCSYGLHVGTWDYASGFGQGAVLTVHVDPRDVVSVPTDSGAQKLRCCSYKVVDITDVPYDVPVVGAAYAGYEGQDFEGFDPWAIDDREESVEEAYLRDPQGFRYMTPGGAAEKARDEARLAEEEEAEEALAEREEEERGCECCECTGEHDWIPNYESGFGGMRVADVCSECGMSNE